MTAPDRERLRRLAREEAARGGMDVDAAAYARFGRDPLDPLLGGGNESAPLGFFGRDPGKDEVRLGEPLVGAGGRLVREGVLRALGRPGPYDLEALLGVSRSVFFSNTVPYKPAGNKAWSPAVKRRFRRVVASYLVDVAGVTDLVTLGNEAFLWFADSIPPAEACRLADLWGCEDRYAATAEVDLESPLSGRVRRLRLHPLPHPSPANATWFRRFPEMLDRRLADLAAGGVRPLLEPDGINGT